MTKTINFAHRREQIKALAALEEGSTLLENGFEVPAKPARYLMIEFHEGNQVWADLSETLPELAEAWRLSETRRDETRFWDLDGDARQLFAVKNVTAFRAGKQTIRVPLSASEDRFGGLRADSAEKVIQFARDKYATKTDDIEIDDEPLLSVPRPGAGADPGCWVAAWVWVAYEDAGVCSQCRSDKSDEHSHCNGDKCGTVVHQEDPYYATPCGTYCSECMRDHARECCICASEFDLRGAEEDDGESDPA